MAFPAPDSWFRRPLPRRGLAVAVAVVLAVSGAAAVHAAQGDDVGALAKRKALEVMTINIENLETAAEADDGPGCGGDWMDLFYAVKKRGLAPDFVLVQQVAGPGQVNTIIDRLERHFGNTDYRFRLADRDPERFNGTRCKPSKLEQTNAIIFRYDRLRPIGGSRQRWQANVGADCTNNHQDRTRAVAHGFRDLRTGKRVKVASIHWATRNAGGGVQCSKNNAVETARGMARGNYDLRIFGGDFNVSTDRDKRFRPWFKELWRDRKYADPIYVKCRDRNRTWRCLGNNWTIGSGNRIDGLFAKSGTQRARTARARTISFVQGDEADLYYTGTDRPSSKGIGRYSDHRAVIARIGWSPA